MPKELIAVVFGGRSVEHEVSIITGHQVMDALLVAGYSVLPVYITKEGFWFAGPGLNNLKQYARPFDPASLRDVHRVSLSPDRSVRQLLAHPDARHGILRKIPEYRPDVFFPAVHGSFGEDGTLQGVLELADVPYVGASVLASAVGMDKVRMKALFRDAGLPLLDCLHASRADWAGHAETFIASIENSFGYPAIVKPVSLGSSIGVSRCKDRNELRSAIETALELDDQVLVERALIDFVEINCSVLGPSERASVCEQPRNSGDLLTFDDKYRQGAKGKGKSSAGSKGGMASLQRIIPAPISPELTSRIQDLAIKAFKAIGSFGVSRIDFLLEEGDKIYVNEINTIPGSLAFYLWEASGLAFDELVTFLVENALQRHQQKSRTRFTFDANLLSTQS
jgi:D-alanine-D-alanine ligase